MVTVNWSRNLPKEWREKMHLSVGAGMASIVKAWKEDWVSPSTWELYLSRGY